MMQPPTSVRTVIAVSRKPRCWYRTSQRPQRQKTWLCKIRSRCLLWVAIPNHLGPQRTPSTLLLEVVHLKDVLKGAGFEAEPSSTLGHERNTTHNNCNYNISHTLRSTILHHPSKESCTNFHMNLPGTLFTRCFSKV